jgi:uncharacterized protein (TIGR03435 family)
MTGRWAFLVVLLGAAAGAQSPGSGTPEFDAVSVKPNNSGGGGRVTVSGGRLRFTPGLVISATVGANGGVSARRIILEAYHLRSNYQLAGGPAWLDSDRFDIEGKANASADENQLRLMLRTMLGQRFRLGVSHKPVEMPVYALIAGKGGTKFPEWRAGEPQPKMPLGKASPPTGGSFTIHGEMQDLAAELSQFPSIDRPVVDKTGLEGTYLFAFQWDADEDFKSVVEQSSGLKLEPQKAQVDILMIDHIEKPDAN